MEEENKITETEDAENKNADMENVENENPDVEDSAVENEDTEEEQKDEKDEEQDKEDDEFEKFSEEMSEIFYFCLKENYDKHKWYIIPMWRFIIKGNHYSMSMDEIKEMLDLEVIRRNIKEDRTLDIINKVQDFFETVTDPYVEQQNNDIAIALLEYMKQNNTPAKKEDSENESKFNKPRLNFSKNMM